MSGTYPSTFDVKEKCVCVHPHVHVYRCLCSQTCVCPSQRGMPGKAWNAAVGFNRLFGSGRFSSPWTHTFKSAQKLAGREASPISMVKWHLSTFLLMGWLGEGAQGVGEEGRGWQHQRSSLLRWTSLITCSISKPHRTGGRPHLSPDLDYKSATLVCKSSWRQKI